MSEVATKEDLNRDLQVALRAVESVLAQQGSANLPEVSAQFSRAVRALVQLRNCMTTACRGNAAIPQGITLDRINALISLMVGVEYPLAGIHWPRIQHARDGLQQMVAG